MSVSELSASNQNYLKAVWSLNEWSDAPVTKSALAARVGVKLSTASDAVRKLTDQGLLSDTRYGAVSLTDAGRQYAIAMVRRHRLIELFLAKALGYRWDQVHDEAENLEHAASDFLIQRIDEHLGHPNRDPHGDPIPRADGSLTKSDAISLTELPTNSSARVERISDEDPELLQYFAEHRLVIGAKLTARPGLPYSETIAVEVTSRSTSSAASAELQLGASAAGAIWVTKV